MGGIPGGLLEGGLENDAYFSGLNFKEVYTSLSYFTFSTFCCHIYFAGLEIEPMQIVGFSKEETSLFLSDCLVICITNEPFCFRDVK